MRAGDDRQPVQRHALGRDDRARACAPSAARRSVRVTQVPGERLDPARLDRAAVRPHSRDVSTSSATITQSAGCAASAEPGEDREARAARAVVLAPAARRAGRRARAGPASSARVHLLGLGRRLVERHADLARGLAQLADEVLPLAHAQVVQVLGLAAACGTALRRQLPLLLAQVAPEVQVGEEVRALVGEAGVRLVGLRALLGRALARVLDRQRGGDDDRPRRRSRARSASSTIRPMPRVDRQLREPAAERVRRVPGRRLRGRARRARAAASTPSRTWRRSGGSRNAKSSTSPRPSAAICRITEARLVRRISGSVKRGRSSKSSSE